MFAALGLPSPEPVPVLAAHHQIAQKIHACTETGSERAHDLVDLQLLWPADEAGVDLVSVTTERLFAFRRTHAFPGTCTVTPDWPTAYAEAATGLDVIADVEPAAGWLNTQFAHLKRRARRNGDDVRMLIKSGPTFRGDGFGRRCYTEPWLGTCSAGKRRIEQLRDQFQIVLCRPVPDRPVSSSRLPGCS